MVVCGGCNINSAGDNLTFVNGVVSTFDNVSLPVTQGVLCNFSCDIGDPV